MKLLCLFVANLKEREQAEEMKIDVPPIEEDWDDLHINSKYIETFFVTNTDTISVMMVSGYSWTVDKKHLQELIERLPK